MKPRPNTIEEWWRDGLRYGNKYRPFVSDLEWEKMCDFYNDRVARYQHKFDPARARAFTFLCRLMWSAYTRILAVRLEGGGQHRDAMTHDLVYAGIPGGNGDDDWKTSPLDRYEASPEDALIMAIDLKAEGVVDLDKLSTIGGRGDD